MSLLFRFTIPMVNGDPLTFREWLPLQNEDALPINNEGLQLRFWIDKECLDHINELNLDALDRYGNIFVGRIYADVSGVTVSDRLPDVMRAWPPKKIGLQSIFAQRTILH